MGTLFFSFSWTSADAEVRAWFAAATAKRGLALDIDRNGNMWAWWGGPGDDRIRYRDRASSRGRRVARADLRASPRSAPRSSSC